MNSRQSKFILTKDGTLRLGEVQRHCELLKPGETCIGGGFYELDYLQCRLLLSGASSQYGEPRWDEIEQIRLSAYYQGLEVLYTSWEDWTGTYPVSDTKTLIYY